MGRNADHDSLRLSEGDRFILGILFSEVPSAAFEFVFFRSCGPLLSQDARLSPNMQERQLRPVLIITIHKKTDDRIVPDVSEPPEPAGVFFRFAVDGYVDLTSFQDEHNGYH